MYEILLQKKKLYSIFCFRTFKFMSADINFFILPILLDLFYYVEIV